MPAAVPPLSALELYADLVCDLTADIEVLTPEVTLWLARLGQFAHVVHMGATVAAADVTALRVDSPRVHEGHPTRARARCLNALSDIAYLSRPSRRDEAGAVAIYCELMLAQCTSLGADEIQHATASVPALVVRTDMSGPCEVLDVVHSGLFATLGVDVKANVAFIEAPPAVAAYLEVRGVGRVVPSALYPKVPLARADELSAQGVERLTALASSAVHALQGV